MAFDNKSSEYCSVISSFGGGILGKLIDLNISGVGEVDGDEDVGEDAPLWSDHNGLKEVGDEDL